MSTVDAIALSGIAAATLKLNASASNLANANDTSALGAKGYLPIKAPTTARCRPAASVAQAVTLKPGSTIIYDPTSAAAKRPRLRPGA